MPSLLGNGSVLQNTSTPSFSYTCHNQVSGPRKMLVFIMGESVPTGPTVSAVTYNGTALTEFVEYQDASGPYNVLACWYLDEASFPGTSGSYTVAATLTSSPAPAMIHVVELDNAWQGDPPVEAYQYVTGATVINNNFSTDYDDSYIVGACCAGQDILFSAESGQTELDEESGGTGGAASVTGYEYISTAGSTAMNWGLSTTTNRCMSLVVEIPPYSAMPGGEDNAAFMGCNF
jgi:hypothetical protein